MSDADDKQQVAPGPHDPEGPAPPGSSGLTRPLQEHLGQQLRTTYQVMEEKPAFLGDTNVPPELEAPLQRLETREKIRHQGLEAVRTALGGDEEPEPAGRPAPADEREGR